METEENLENIFFDFEEPLVIKFTGQYNTNHVGYMKLVKFYDEANKHKDKTISLDFYDMKWLDANLSALLQAMLHKLVNENNLSFSTDGDYIKKKFKVLMKNNLIETDGLFDDNTRTILPLKQFDPKEKEKFVDFVNNDLIRHEGLPIAKAEIYDKVRDDLIEIFTNVNLHARTNDPLFICGQYFPKNHYFVLTMVDIGIGFLQPIKEFTQNKRSIEERIIDDEQAIRWALSGKSTKKDAPGGIGLSGILKYCTMNNGIFQIVTGNSYWGTDYESSIFRGAVKIKSPFCGTMINLFFSWN